MINRIFSLMLLIIGITNLAFAQTGNLQIGLKLDKPAIDFTLEDTEESRFKLTDARGKILVLTVVAEADSREGRNMQFKANEKWIKAIRQEYSDKIRLIGMARMNVSIFTKGIARTKIRQTQSIRFLLDWKGDVFKHYGHKGVPTIVLIDEQGIVRHIVVGNYSPETAKHLFDVLDSMLAKDEPERSVTRPAKPSEKQQESSVQPDGDKILKKIDENLMPNSYVSYRKLINIEPNGRKKEFIFFTVKKGKDKIAMLYLSPASERGKATLRLGENVWLYIPNVGRPVRISSLQSIVGGVFNNSDIMLLEFHVEYNVAQIRQTNTKYILDLKAKNKTVAYDKLKMWARKDGLVLTKVECYSATGMLLKTLDYKQIRDFGEGISRPSVIETYSPLYKGYKSVMIFNGVEKKDFPDEVFTLNYLPRLEELR